MIVAKVLKKINRKTTLRVEAQPHYKGLEPNRNIDSTI